MWRDQWGMVGEDLVVKYLQCDLEREKIEFIVKKTEVEME